MITLKADFYDTLAQEIITQIVDQEMDDGVVEIDLDADSQAVFVFSNADYTLSGGISSMSYVLLAFKNGRRESTDFYPEKLNEKITL